LSGTTSNGGQDSSTDAPSAPSLNGEERVSPDNSSASVTLR